MESAIERSRSANLNWYKKAVRKIVIPAEDYDNLMALVNKMASGKIDYTQEELQLQQNYPEALEVLLKNKAA